MSENPKAGCWDRDLAGPRTGSTAACWGSKTGRNSRKEPQKAVRLATGSVEGGQTEWSSSTDSENFQHWERCLAPPSSMDSSRGRTMAGLTHWATAIASKKAFRKCSGSSSVGLMAGQRR